MLISTGILLRLLHFNPIPNKQQAATIHCKNQVIYRLVDLPGVQARF